VNVVEIIIIIAVLIYLSYDPEAKTSEDYEEEHEIDPCSGYSL